MNKAPVTLANLVDEYDIDIYQLFRYFDEAIYRDEQVLVLTEHFVTRESMERTEGMLLLLKKFKEGLLLYCQRAKLLPLTSRHHDVDTDYIRQTNALRFLSLVKEFPTVLDELT